MTLLQTPGNSLGIKQFWKKHRNSEIRNHLKSQLLPDYGTRGHAVNPSLLFVFDCSLKSKVLKWISRSNGRSWLRCFLQAQEAQANPEAQLFRFKGRLQICPEDLSIQCWALPFKSQRDIMFTQCYISKQTQMEDNCVQDLQYYTNVWITASCAADPEEKKSALAAREPLILRCCSNINVNRLML